MCIMRLMMNDKQYEYLWLGKYSADLGIARESLVHVHDTLNCKISNKKALQ